MCHILHGLTSTNGAVMFTPHRKGPFSLNEMQYDKDCIELICTMVSPQATGLKIEGRVLKSGHG